MKETFPKRLLQGSPNVIADGKAVLACGCYVFVGVRLDTMETATAAAPCGFLHQPLIETYMRLQDANPRPARVPLLDHVDRLLTAAEAAATKRTA